MGKVKPHRWTIKYKNISIWLDAIRSEQFENLHKPTTYEPRVKTGSKQIITFARHEYERVGVLRIKMRSIV